MLCYCVIIGLEMFVFMKLSDFFLLGRRCLLCYCVIIGLEMFVFMKLSDFFFIGQEVFAVLLCHLVLGWRCLLCS